MPFWKKACKECGEAMQGPEGFGFQGQCGCHWPALSCQVVGAVGEVNPAIGIPP